MSIEKFVPTLIFLFPYSYNNIHEKILQFWSAESSAINPKPCNFVLSVQILAGKKPSREKQNMAAKSSSNSGNISLKFEVNSTLILPEKCRLNKLEES